MHSKEMLDWVRHLQIARSKNIWLVGILDKKLDDHDIPVYSFQIEGSKTSDELVGIVDEILVMALTVNPKDPSKRIRIFICQPDNLYDVTAKDRSGKLDLYEEPHLDLYHGKNS
ncbi:AAA family ATPase [Candidatus Liberibacter africanus]|uniref:AAA family ATPase n=1 Tax=Liberibacter africanus TaxID=34020 RepID=UPI00244EBC32|nr:AAA family ATPase [Candidatus Liberibacter africanus]